MHVSSRSVDAGCKLLYTRLPLPSPLLFTRFHNLRRCQQITIYRLTLRQSPPDMRWSFSEVRDGCKMRWNSYMFLANSGNEGYPQRTR